MLGERGLPARRQRGFAALARGRTAGRRRRCAPAPSSTGVKLCEERWITRCPAATAAADDRRHPLRGTARSGAGRCAACRRAGATRVASDHACGLESERLRSTSEAAHGRCHQRRVQRGGELARHRERAGVVAAVAWRRTRRHPRKSARVFARESGCRRARTSPRRNRARPLLMIAAPRRAHQTSSGSSRNTLRVPSLQLRCSDVKYGSPSAKRRRIRTSRLSRS